VEQNAPAELDDGATPAPVEAVTEVVAVVPSPEDQAEPVTATCPLGCDWTGSFADQGRKATALALHVEHCDNAPHNKPREEGGRLAGKDDGERAKARPGADLASSPSSPQNVPEPVTPWLGGEGEGGQPADEGTRSPAPAGSDESSPVPSRPPSPIPLDELAALYAASGPGEPSLIGAPFVFHPDTDLIVLDRPTLPAPIEQLLHVPTGPDGDQPLGSMLLTPPALIDGRWTLDPYLFRADVLALMIVAQHLQERRFEGWYDPAIEQTHLRAYGLLDGQLVVVRASTHRDVASGSTCIVAEPKLAALAEAEKVELAADDFAAAHGVLAQLDAEWSQAADTLLLPASNGAVQA
jgi:hypothetical protein